MLSDWLTEWGRRARTSPATSSAGRCCRNSTIASGSSGDTFFRSKELKTNSVVFITGLAMMQKRELLTEASEKATTVIIKEISPNGIKLQYNAQGMVKGKYNAGHLETVDIVQKTDGTFEYEARGIDSTQAGDLVVLMGKGTGKQTTPTTASFQGEISFMTQSKTLAWLNSAKGWVEGTTNQQTNEANFKVYTIG